MLFQSATVARPFMVMWSKVAVAAVGAPPLVLWKVTGEVTKSPILTVAGNPARRAVPISSQVVPLVES